MAMKAGVQVQARQGNPEIRQTGHVGQGVGREKEHVEQTLVPIRATWEMLL